MVELCEKTGWQKILRMPDIFELRLRIPNYQRPYKWTKHNIEDLLSDIEDVIHAKKNAYRVGTLILHPSNDDGGFLAYDIVDGQQRILTFTLLKMAMEPYFPEHIIARDGVHDSLDPFYSFSLLHDTNCQKNLSSDKLSLKNMHINYLFIKKYIDSIGDDQRVLLKTTIDEIIQFVVIAVEKQAEAFQLFDSQNTRGKRLFPHDLLKHIIFVKSRTYT